MKILVTGFDPFGGETVNPAWEAVSRLPAETGGAEIVKLQVPTMFGRAPEAVLREVERLRPDAEAYAQFRERIGAIECEARKRAADLELATETQLRKTVALFQEQYQALMTAFEAAAGHVTGELRKVEVNLAQLPRTMDPAGAALKSLSARLERENQKK